MLGRPQPPSALASCVVSVDHLWPLVNFAKVGLSAAEASEDDVVFIGWMISDYVINVDYATVDILDVSVVLGDILYYLLLRYTHAISTIIDIAMVLLTQQLASAWFSPISIWSQTLRKLCQPPLRQKACWWYVWMRRVGIYGCARGAWYQDLRKSDWNNRVISLLVLINCTTFTVFVSVESSWLNI